MADFDGTIQNSVPKLTFAEVKAKVGMPGPYFFMKAVRLLQDNPQEEPAIFDVTVCNINLWWLCWYMAKNGCDNVAAYEQAVKVMNERVVDEQVDQAVRVLLKEWLEDRARKVKAMEDSLSLVFSGKHYKRLSAGIYRPEQATEYSSEDSVLADVVNKNILINITRGDKNEQ